MRLFIVSLVVSALVVGSACSTAADSTFRIAIHGGAGTILRENMTAEQEQAYHDKLSEALQAGYDVLDQGGKSVDAVQAAIIVMEDSPLFNAGKGAVFTHDKNNEMDASIMDGETLDAGAVAGVSTVRNPIKLAAAVKDHSPHVMLSGSGAEEFAVANDLEIVDKDYFKTERRLRQINEVLERENNMTDSGRGADLKLVDEKFGTVGAVALDKFGNLAAATSTGGMTNKRFGRIGDSPIIGAGTYADNESCAISATGHGEFFIRAAVAHDICARSAYLGLSLQEAADAVIMDKLVEMGGGGGIVGVDPHGNVVYSFNTPGMYRGSMGSDGKSETAIYK